MAKEKVSRIANCEFTNEWQNPAGGMVYYHEVTMENGDKGSVGSMDKNPLKLAINTVVTYTIEGEKIKIVKSGGDKPKQDFKSSNQGNGNANKKSYDKTPADFLGFTWGYAKDLIIAGKTMNDVEELNKVARYIYDQIKEMLAND
jgi:hypothetical protein